MKAEKVVYAGPVEPGDVPGNHQTASNCSASPKRLTQDPASRVCVACYFTQLVFEDTALELPRGVASCGLPDENISMDSMAEAASSLFNQLFPGLEFLAKSGKWACQKEGEGVCSDDSEDKDPLEAALKALGVSQ
jgi:hypothetical protein